jgi:hypothetical protein
MAVNYGFSLIQALDSNGDPLSGAKLHTYVDDGGTTDKATYTDIALTSAAANPVVDNANGRFGDLYGSGAYKLVLKTSADVTVWTRTGVGAGDTATLDNFKLVDTQAELTALDMTDGSTPTTVFVRGSSSAYDGDHFIFYWDASSTATPVANQILQNDAGGTGRHIRLYEPKQVSTAEAQALTATDARAWSPADWKVAYDDIRTSSEATATAGPEAVLERDNALSANDDFLGQHIYQGKNDAAQDVKFAGVGGKIINVADGSEDGAVILYAMIAGTLTAVAQIGMLTDTVQGFNLLVGDYFKNSTTAEQIEKYSVTGQTVTADTTLTKAHGLTGKPDLIVCKLVCGTADLGYSAGEEVHYDGWDNTGDKGITRWADATNVVIEQGNQMELISQTSQNIENITNGSWTWSIIAIKFNV